MKTYSIFSMAFLYIISSIIIFAQPTRYEYSLEGGTVNSHGNISPTKATMLIGGAEAGASAEIAATSWFLNNADGGDYLVIRTGGTGGQAAWVWDNFSSMISSAAEISIDNRNAANNATVAQYIYDAEAIFIAGGDQTSYVDNWKDTEVETALNYVINVKGIPVSGTSAGMAILGSAYYAPATSGVLSSEILNDPYNNNMNNSLFYDDFLDIPYLNNVITDTHLNRTHGTNNENRYGRIFGFLARTVNDQNSTGRYAIGCEEGTFVCINSSGIARVFGNGNSNQTRAYFLQVNCQAPETIQSGSPLVWNNNNQAVKVYQIPGTSNGNGNSFDLNNWSSASGGGWMDWYTSEGYSGFNFINGSGATTGASAPSNCSGNPGECNTPTAPNSSNITSNSASISWLDAGSNSYDLQYRESGSTNWTTINTANTTQNISGLAANTTYEYRVRSVCTSTNSSYSSISQFTTLSGGGPVDYCPSSGGSTQYEYIDEVAINSQSNLSGNDNGYGDYTNFTFNLTAGNSYTMYIYPQTSDREIFIVWIDFNQDGDFVDSNEEILFANSRRRIRKTITIPSIALSGNTRMRVSMKYASDGEQTPCENFQFGEVEDYTVNINNGAGARTTPLPPVSFNNLSNETLIDNLVVYPNPSKGLFTINVDRREEVEISVYDILGNHILTQKDREIDLRNEESGIYILKIKTVKQTQIVRLVKD
ncbi:GEVED domain-containing protein [Marinigracilibium pacificum]|uniref:T9SS type A sorting domain-containing protein n=1 Tax=Marinigracilibium pacificum TaxID=2729599 RepID=A0A848IZT4_9BACT|nr:GEVED domain-containing protein [Marinigracilibium pacificum]NMM47810.1 T9SS type A sorting domain-containing protein [Marinigracilibium pacificum]